MSVTKTIEEINSRIRSGTAVVLTAEEVARMAQTASPAEIARQVDVVTTATFGPMCSSGAFINFGHTTPGLRMEEITLNDVPVYGGVAAVDAYIGATSVAPENPEYGGGHVIEDLVRGRELHLKARGHGTDCYPRREVSTWITKDTVNEIFLFNPRNAYQNYGVAVNSTDHTLHTYMGALLGGLRNAAYSTSGELSPLLNDPELRTIGLGTRIFLCGAEGYVVWPGTQFNTTRPRNAHDIPVAGGATLAVMGDLKQMSPDYLRAAVLEKYGVSLFVGIGIPIPVLDEDLARRVSIRNEQIETTIFDYGTPDHDALGRTNYAILRSGELELNGRKIPCSPLSSLSRARKIADELGRRIRSGAFLLTAPVMAFPTNTRLKSCELREAGALLGGVK